MKKAKPKSALQLRKDNALFQAIQQGRCEELAQLVEDGADLGGIKDQATPLTAATIGNQLTAVQKLLELKADVNAMDAQHRTALTHALLHGHIDIGKWLVRSGADLNATNVHGDSRLTLAARDGQQDRVDQLIALGVDVNVPNHLGTSALQLAVTYPGIVHSLLAAKADPTHAASSGALQTAVYMHQVVAARMLLAAGARPNVVDQFGKTLLTYAVEQAEESLVRSMIAAGAHLDQQALAAALHPYRPGVLQALVDAGARPDLSQHSELHPSQALVSALKCGAVHALCQWFPAPHALDPPGAAAQAFNPMPLAVKLAPAAVINHLRAAGYAIDALDACGHNLLMLASMDGCPYKVFSLLRPIPGQPGLDPNAQARLSGATALMCAAEHGRTHAMKVLLANGADPSIKDRCGYGLRDYAKLCQDLRLQYEMQLILDQAMTGECAFGEDFCASTPAQGSCLQEPKPGPSTGFHAMQDDIDAHTAAMELVGCAASASWSDSSLPPM